MLTRRRLSWLSAILALVVGAAILYPTYFAIKAAFDANGKVGLTSIRAVIDNPGFKDMMINTGVIAVGSAAIAVVLGTIMAITTTVLPLRRFERRVLQLAPIAPLTIPALAGATGWLFLLAPQAGWINIWIRGLTGSHATSGPISAYSIVVVVWVMGLYAVPYVYTIMASSMSRMNTELLESYQASGCPIWGAMLRAIVGPLRPAFLAACSLAVVDCISQFSVPLVLNVNTLPTYMYNEVTNVGSYGTAAAAGLPLFVIAVLLTIGQMRLNSKGGRWTTVSGRGSGVRNVSLGKKSDRALKGITYLYFLLAGVAPLLAIFAVSLLDFWRPNITFHDLVLSNYTHVWNDQLARSGVGTSLKLAIGCALIATAVALLVVILVERVGGPSTKLLYFFANLPLGLPLVLLGLAFLVAFISGPIVLYGTIWLLVLAYSVAFLPIAIRNIGPLFQQVGKDMEEAASVSGAGWFRSLRKVTAPLVMPGIASSGALLFMLIFREFPIAAFLSTPTTNVISMALVAYNTDGAWPYVAVVALFLSAVSIVVFVVANVIAGRYSLARQRTSGRRRGATVAGVPDLLGTATAPAPPLDDLPERESVMGGG